MKTRFVTFHNGNLNPDLVSYQKKVFDKFGIPLEQIETKLSHGEAIDHFVNTEAWDLLVLFDTDCIPLKWDDVYIKEIGLEPFDLKLFGAPQNANHIKGSKDYVAPAFMILRRDLWEYIGKPSFVPNKSDCAADVTYACYDKGVRVEYLNVLSCDKPLWKLENGTMFGYGTTFGNLFVEVYHAFESNAGHSSTSRFIEKCKQALHQ